MAGLGHHDQRETVVVTIPASHFLASIELIVVGVDLAWLQVEHLPTGKVNLLDPLERGPHAIFHVVISDIDEDVESAGEQVCEETCRVVLTVSDGICYFAAGAHKCRGLCDVQRCFQLFKAV